MEDSWGFLEKAGARHNAPVSCMCMAHASRPLGTGVSMGPSGACTEGFPLIACVVFGYGVKSLAVAYASYGKAAGTRHLHVQLI